MIEIGQLARRRPLAPFCALHGWRVKCQRCGRRKPKNRQEPVIDIESFHGLVLCCYCRQMVVEAVIHDAFEILDESLPATDQAFAEQWAEQWRLKYQK